MKVLRRSSGCFHRSICIKTSGFVLLFLVLMIICFYNSVISVLPVCDKPVHGNLNPKISEKAVENLKLKWQAEYNGDSISKSIGDAFPDSDLKPESISSIECLINDDYTVQCLQSNDEPKTVYMPFNFIEKYFDVTGKVKQYNDHNRFEFTQSYAKAPYSPTTQDPYIYKGVFMTFEKNQVESRERVKCISGIEGVPLSKQWSKEGYFYAIQISQFGLSHYSKYLTEKRPRVTIYENGENSIKSKWKTSDRRCYVKAVQDREVHSKVINFYTPADTPIGSGAILKLENTAESVISFDVKFVSNGSVSVVLDTSGKTKQYTIHYVTTELVVDFDSPSNIFYGIGGSITWKRISRNLNVDLVKALLNAHASKLKVKVLKVSRIILRGEGFIDNVTISKAAHLDNFRDASDWLVRNQDQKTGGWKNMVKRSFAGCEVLQPGWISAMGQGQAMSVLSRAYASFGDKNFIRAMSKALKPFTVASADGGVKAVFMDKYVWYEEYPTKPSSFVLNGFMFSLIGLYDFKSLLEDKFKLNSSEPLSDQVSITFTEMEVDLRQTYKLVSQLFEDGFNSLKALLPMYDGGSRTFYDLRHFTLKIQPNVARWDYHNVHVSQLALFFSVTNDPILQRYHDYWYGYTKGNFAAHN